ncbi:MAG: hypothetical protein R3A79_01070 [Nannocystaceae bacterium]
MPIGVTIVAATLAFGGAVVGKVKIARARARVRRRLAVPQARAEGLTPGSIVKVVGRARAGEGLREGPLSGRPCVAWEVAIRPGKGSKETKAVALCGGCDFLIELGDGAALPVVWDPSAELLFGPDLGFRYARQRTPGDVRASAITACLEWKEPIAASAAAALEIAAAASLVDGRLDDALAPEGATLAQEIARMLPDVAEFQRRFAAFIGVEELVLPPKRGAIVGEERILVDGQEVALLGVVGAAATGAGGDLFLAGSGASPLALATVDLGPEPAAAGG